MVKPRFTFMPGEKPLIFTIPGEPVGKARPRFVRRGNSVSTYTPKQTATYERAVKYYFRLAHRDPAQLRGPISVKITAILGVPLSGSKLGNGRKLSGITRPTKKPDADNILKVICDSLNNVAWRDDAQVVEACISKHYGPEPRVVVEIIELNGGVPCES